MYSIRKALRTLSQLSLLGFDVECRSAYTVEEIEEAKSLLKKPELVDPEHLINVKLVARSSGLSNPIITRTTHFIFGIAEDESVILVADNPDTEQMIWNWLITYKGKTIVHNAGFDLKICFQRTGRLPLDYEDTQLLAKTFINNADNWKSKVGLKELMGGYYSPKWSLFEDYNIRNLNDPNFLMYAAIDGASTFKLWHQLQEYTP